MLLGRLLGRGHFLRTRCSEACTARLVLRRKGRALTAPVSVSLQPGVATRVGLHATRAAHRLLLPRHATAVAVLVARAVDGAANSRTLRLGIRLSR